MEQKIIFRDYQEQQASDHNDLQSFARTSFDHLVLDAVTATRRYAGFATQKSAQTEVQVAPGRFFDVLGAVYHRDTTLVQSMTTYLPAVSKRIVLISVYGAESETSVEERDFLVDVDTGRTEPSAVATVSSRDAVLALASGPESSDPQPPSTPVGHAPIAYVTLDTTQVVSVEMLDTYQVVSTENLDDRADALELFKSQIEPRVSSLASDLAALATKYAAINQGSNISLEQVYKDLAVLKQKADLPMDYSDYGADEYINPTYSDTDDSGGLGYDCKIGDGGLTFNVANENAPEISLYSPNDSNLTNNNGLVLPAFTDVLKMQTGSYTAELGISQYQYQTIEIVQKSITRYRIRYGCYWAWWGPHWPYWYYYVYGLYPDWTWAAYYPWCLGWYWYYPYYWYRYYPYCWVESYTEYYTAMETTTHNIDGAMVAQSFLVANDMWCTKLGFYITAKAAAENIFLTLCELTSGMPDVGKAIMHMIYPEDDIVVGWNRVKIQPTFMKSGTRYALVFVSNANHKIGMTSGESYIDGTFFHSTDGVYYLGDLTTDMMLEVWGARFNNPQSEIVFSGINLSEGIRSVDIMARTIIPDSTQLVYEIQESGKDWVQMTPDNPAGLSGASPPPLLSFRGRFLGTRDVQPGLMLTNSRLHASRPKTTFRHVSEVYNMDTPSHDITIQIDLKNYDETPHDCTLHIYQGAAYIEPTTTTSETLDSVNKIVRKKFHFLQASPAISSFRIVINGSTTSSANLFAVTEMLFWSETLPS